MSAKAFWWDAALPRPAAASPLPFTAQFDAPSSASGPSGFTLWIQEADLFRRPPGIARQPDDLELAVYGEGGGGGSMWFPIRLPLEFTSLLQPNRIDLGFKKCWYLVKATYTGGFPITRIMTGPVAFEPAVDTRWLSQRLARGALLQMEIPARPAVIAAKYPPHHVSVYIQQLGRSATEVKIPVVNVPLDLNDALPSGGCDYSAPSVLPSR